MFLSGHPAPAAGGSREEEEACARTSAPILSPTGLPALTFPLPLLHREGHCPQARLAAAAVKVTLPAGARQVSAVCFYHWAGEGAGPVGGGMLPTSPACGASRVYPGFSPPGSRAGQATPPRVGARRAEPATPGAVEVQRPSFDSPFAFLSCCVFPAARWPRRRERRGS